MRPISPRLIERLRCPDPSARVLVEAQAEQRSSSKKDKSNFQTADTFTARTADFTAGNALVSGGQTVSASLTSAPAANALYEAHFKVTINTTVPSAGTNTITITVAVETDPTNTGVWTEQWARDYDLPRKVGEPATAVIYAHERLPVRVTGFNSSGKLRLKLKSVSGPGSVSVHGFNAATDLDMSAGVTYHTGPAFDFLDGGQGVTLADTVLSKISLGTSDGLETDLNGPALSTSAAPFIVARLVWGKDDSNDIAIDRFTAQLNPCVDGVPGNKNVAWFVCRPYALVSAGRIVGGTTDRVVLAPLCDPVIKEAGDGTSAQDYVFSFSDRSTFGPGHTIVSLSRKPRPKSIKPTWQVVNPQVEYESSPTTFWFIWALQADNSPASNVGWARDSGVSEVTNGSRRLRTVAVTRRGDVWEAEDIVSGAASRPVFRCKIECGSYASANLEFTGANLLDLGASPTETVEFVAVAAVPLGTGSVFEVRNDADSAWLPFTDGQTAAQVGVSQRQTYKVRWRAITNTETDATPTLYEIGVRDVKRVWLGDLATVRATWSIPDVAELVPAIPEAEIIVHKNGEQDFKDRITVLLSENYIGSLMFRVWVGDPNRDRAEWVHKDDFVLVDDYDPSAPTVTIVAHSALVLLNGALPIYNTVTQTQETLRLANKTPTQVWDELVGVQLAADIPSKYRGDITALGASMLLSKTILDSDGKTELDAVAHAAGCVLSTSRGKISAFDMFTPGAIQAVIPSSKITWRSSRPGLGRRVPELFASYDYLDNEGRYRGMARVISADANLVTRMGGVGRLDADRNLRDAVCRWLPTEVLARQIAQRRVNTLGTGEIVWSFTCADPYPELEFGDRILVETDRFMARDPLQTSLRAVKGALWAIGRVVEYDVEGRELTIWVQGYTDVLTSIGAVTRVADLDFVKGSTRHNNQGSFLPIGSTNKPLSYDSSTNSKELSWTWSTFTLYRPDRTTVTVPASSSLPTPPAPSLSQQASGVQGARTYGVRLAYVRGGHISGVGTFGTFAISANNVLVVASPPFVAGYDGWIPLISTNGIDDAGCGVRTQAPAATPNAFGVTFIEAAAGPGSLLSGTAGSVMAGKLFAVNLSLSTSYFLYPYFDVLNGMLLMAGLPTETASSTLAQEQHADGHVAIGDTGITGVTASNSLPASGNPGSGNGGRYL